MTAKNYEPKPLPYYSETQMKILNAKKAIIESTNGSIFTCCFVKATTGEERIMNCRLGVSKYVVGGHNPNPRIGYDQMIVADLQAPDPENPYRTLNLSTVKWIKERGNVHTYK